jgi:polyhydroxyalkanoate synthesis repressor PhaR
MPILIKRYANRKLYDTQASRYITLKGIAALLDRGEEVRVIDNETGEDITSVALSQILVDTKRSNRKAPTSLLSQIMERGGDALYDAIKKSVDDASGGLDEIQDRIRRIIQNDEQSSGGSSADSGEDRDGAAADSDRRAFKNWIAFASPDFDSVIQNSIERVFKVLDLPRRKDIDELSHSLERVLQIVEKLERQLDERPVASPDTSTGEADPAATSDTDSRDGA